MAQNEFICGGFTFYKLSLAGFVDHSGRRLVGSRIELRLEGVRVVWPTTGFFGFSST
ncbi:hypothetical protein OHU45_02825 [Streptomyces tubercidicus]|uniref:hypothetical protein n=1 Tax=Streptomyces tubercidicus TaxID=47759 RepID=UPI002E16244A|nr:hypothetical protein OG761_02645 [Streptomyces tubercidicus]